MPQEITIAVTIALIVVLLAIGAALGNKARENSSKAARRSSSLESEILSKGPLEYTLPQPPKEPGAIAEAPLRQPSKFEPPRGAP